MLVSTHKDSPILVVGGTGAQGGATIRALLADGASVRALVRDPATAVARALASEGACLVRGDLDDVASLSRAMEGVRGVFSVQLYDPRDPSAETRQAWNLIQAAKTQGVEVFVQTTVSGAGSDRTPGDRAESRWDRVYWDNKADIETSVLSAGFAAGVVLKPAFMMENLITPKSAWMFPDLATGRIVTAIDPSTRIAFVAASDIGRMAARAFARPRDFTGVTIEMAGERLTLADVAATLAGAWGEAVVVETLDPGALTARGQSAGWVKTQQWMNEVGYPADPDRMRLFGLEPLQMAQWAAQNRDRRPLRTA